jgi:hypothetical protein
VLGAAGLLLVGVLPLRGQVETTTVRVESLGPSARIGRTRVAASFALPARVRLGRVPRVRVTNPRGELEELLPMLFVGGDRSLQCYRDLHSDTYASGTYQVECEIETIDAVAARVTVRSAPRPLSVR